MRLPFSLCCLCLLLATIAARAMDHSAWRPRIWRGEAAWESRSGNWTAIVSEKRCRLVALVSNRGENLLFAESREAISWGGHRVWLGPQDLWPESWPPPAEWEASACRQARTEGTRITLVAPRSDSRFPVLSRAYWWSAGVLHCKVEWSGGHFHAIQIIQIPAWALVHVDCVPSPRLPLGYALMPVFGKPDRSKDLLLSSMSIFNGHGLTLWKTNVTEKVAVRPQAIMAKIGICQLSVRRGANTGLSRELPDQGLLTQIFLGDWMNPFIELEQLSGYSTGQPASFEILLEPGFAPSQQSTAPTLP